jgi:hypothetical protein
VCGANFDGDAGYYKCHRRKAGCDSRSIRQETIEQAVLGVLFEEYLTVETLASIREQLVRLESTTGARHKRDIEGLSGNPEGFYEQVIRPMYQKMNIDAAGVIRQNAMIYNRTGGALANEWEKQLSTIEKAVAAFQKTLDISAATAKLPDSITGQEKEFEAAWTDFKTQFGTTVLPLFTGILKGGASIFRHLNDNQHFPNGREADDLFWQKHNGGSGQRYDRSLPSMFGNPVGESRFIAPVSNKPINITVQSVLDGRVIAESTAQHFGDSANGSQTGTSLFDPTQAPFQAGGLGP